MIGLLTILDQNSTENQVSSGFFKFAKKLAKKTAEHNKITHFHIYAFARGAGWLAKKLSSNFHHGWLGELPDLKFIKQPKHF